MVLDLRLIKRLGCRDDNPSFLFGIFDGERLIGLGLDLYHFTIPLLYVRKQLSPFLDPYFLLTKTR